METVLSPTPIPTLEKIKQARGLLVIPVARAASPWAGLGAAAFAATAAVLMAGVMVLGPGIALENDASPPRISPSS